MKYVKWILFSLVLHVSLISLMGAWEKISMGPDEAEILDLTFYQTGSEQSATSPAASQRTPPAKVSSKLPATMVQKETGPSDSNTTDENSAASSNAAMDANEGPGEGSAGGEVPWGDITEFPKVLGEVKAAYPEEAKKAGISGAVVLELVIGKEGQLQAVKVISGPGYGLEESATEAIKKFRFKPAKKGKESVAVRIQYTYRFKLDIN